LNLELSAFSFSADRMLTLRPIEPVAIEKQMASPDAPAIFVSVSTIDAADADGLLPGEILQQEEAPARRERQERPAYVPRNAPSIQSDVLVKSFALAFVGLLCTTLIGFVWEIRPLRLDSPEYGYDKVGTETTSPSSADFLSNCSGDGPATIGKSKDGLDRPGVSAIAAHAASPTASFTPTE
jgi:hypothetical protein